MRESSFEKLLSGGHPNSLGETELVTSQVLNNKSLLPVLLDCYKSEDPVVRLRTSSCLKRVCQQQPEWIYEHIQNLFYPDWIVQNTTMQVLFEFIESDPTIKPWLKRDLESLTESPWKSVGGRATKLLKIIGEQR